MAVKKTEVTATEVAGSEKTEAADNSAIKAEKAADGAQTQPQAAEKDQNTVKLIYIGPSLPKALLKSNRVFEGTPDEIRKELETVIEKFPLVERLIVPVAGMAEKKDKVRTAGNILNKYYSDIASAAYAMEKEG